MSPRDMFINKLSEDILELVRTADTLDHSDLTAQAMAIAMAAWQHAGDLRTT